MKAKQMRKRLLAGLAGLLLTTAAGSALAAEEVMNIYTLRQEVLIRPLLDEFTKETGIQTKVVFLKEGLAERLQAEGRNTPADVALTVDIVRLVELDQAGLLQPVDDPALKDAVPPAFRDPEGAWYGVSLRARPIMYSAERVKPSELSTYEDLADPKWKGRICIRTSSHPYNQALVSAIIAHDGQAKAEEWAKGFAANLARTPKGGDRDQIKAVAAGECDIAIANTYYLAGMAESSDAAEREAAGKVKVFWPNQQSWGTHVNLSGAGVTKHAPHKENAVKLLRFLVSDKAQKMYADVVHEYPVVADVQPSATLKSWGSFNADELNLTELAKHNQEAVKIADRAGWR